MIYIISFSLITTVVLLTVMTRAYLKSKHRVQELERNVSELKSIRDELVNKLEVSKLTYSKDREILIKSHEVDKIELSFLKEELANFSDEQSRYYREMDNLINCSKEMTPENLLTLRSSLNSDNSDTLDFTGIYILENKAEDKFYVGQSINVIKRVANHFNNAGNKDIYEDYISGQEWTIKLIALSNSGFKSINALEKHFIQYYKSTHNGYNKTIGNKI